MVAEEFYVWVRKSTRTTLDQTISKDLLGPFKSKRAASAQFYLRFVHETGIEWQKRCEAEYNPNL
jgi:hypothetical protein